MTIPLIYVAGAITDGDERVVRHNIERAKAMGRLIIDAGGYPVIPHQAAELSLTMRFQRTWDWWMEATSRALDKCDACIVVPSVQIENKIKDTLHPPYLQSEVSRVFDEMSTSRGTKLEIEQCIRTNKPLFFAHNITKLPIFSVAWIHATVDEREDGASTQPSYPTNWWLEINKKEKENE